MKIKIVNKSNNPLPKYETEYSAGMDIRATLNGIKEEFFHYSAIDMDTLLIFSGGRALIPTGLFIELPKGYEAQIRPRSGLALKNGITILNTPGTIDSDYRGEIGIIIQNLSDDVFEIKEGDRICQMVINEFKQIELLEVDELTETDRGNGGFGHTGK